MSILNKIKTSGNELPPRLILSGPEGIGKTTFASKFPDPLFISSENGMTGFENIPHIEPESFDDVMQLVDTLIIDKAGYKTLVIDTVDWLERMIHKSLIIRDGKNNIEDYGYGKGYKLSEGFLVQLLSKLDQLRNKGVGILLLSHVQIRTFNSPDGESWERYENKGHKGFTGILREWPDACLFATYQVFRKGTDLKSKLIGGERILHTSWSPGWDAKNRLNLPETLPMEYSALVEAIQANNLPALRKNYLDFLSNSTLSDELKKKHTSVLQTLSADKLKDGISKLKEKQK